MKKRTVQRRQVDEAVEAVRELESETGVKVKSGLRAGDGSGGGKGNVYQPLYGAPTSEAS